MRSIVVAMSENRIIGRGGALPWHLPDDLRRFKALTMGHPIVMGRKTFESIGRPLPGRTNIVITRNPEWTRDDVVVIRNLEEAMAAAEAMDDEAEVFIIGGAEIFREAMLTADRLIVTLVHAIVDGDTGFPAIDPAEWRLVREDHHDADAEHKFAFTFQTWERD